MGIIILTWNPDEYPEDEIFDDESLDELDSYRPVPGSWSTGSRKQGVGPGDIFIHLRQKHDRGIVGLGEVTSEPFQDAHWDGSGRLANYIDVRWWMWEPDPGAQIATEDLIRVIPEVKWNALLGSGVMVPEEVEAALEKLIIDTWLPGPKIEHQLFGR